MIYQCGFMRILLAQCNLVDHPRVKHCLEGLECRIRYRALGDRKSLVNIATWSDTVLSAMMGVGFEEDKLRTRRFHLIFIDKSSIMFRLDLLRRRSERGMEIFFESTCDNTFHVFVLFLELNQLFSCFFNQIFIRFQLLLKSQFLCFRLFQSL